MNNYINIAMGIGLSALAPQWAQKENRIERQIDDLAASRKVESWYAKFKRHKIDGEAGELILRIHETKDAKEVFVFMPGTNAYTLLYGQFLLAIADLGYTVIGFDPRGHGSSDGNRGSYVLEELLDDYHQVVDFATKKYDLPITVSGSSQGGIIAFYYALNHEDLAAAICHNIADLSDPASVYLTRFGRFGHFLKPIIKASAKIIPELPIPMPAYLDLTKERVKGHKNALEVLLKDPLIPWFVRLKTMSSLGGTEPPKPISQLKVPTLIIQAQHDSIFPTKYIEKIANKTSMATMAVIPNSYHYVIVDEVDKVIQEIINWIK